MIADPGPQLIEVRAATPAELPAVRRLVSAAYAEFEPYLTPANWSRMTGNIARVVSSGASGQLLIAYLADRLAGTVTYLPPGPKDYHRVPQEWAVIRVLGVDPALRGRGVARALTEECLARARADRAPAVGLHTATMMTAARTLYEAAGFVHHADFTHLGIGFSIYLLRCSGAYDPPMSRALESPLRVVVVDDHQMVLDGLRAMLDAYSDQVHIVGEATEPDLAIKLIVELEPDITLLDVRLRGSSGLDLCAEIRRRRLDCKVVFLTVYDDEQYLYQALRLGAAGFLLKRVRGAELVDHLQRIHQGEILIDPSLATKVAMSVAHLRGGEFWPGAHLGLTQRESEVLALMVAGLSNRAIAGRLTVSEETVKTHARGIYRKFDVPDRSSAVAAALREGVFQ